MQDARRFAPATSRNREPILTVLKTYLRDEGLILEIASGSGEHCVYFAENLPSYRYRPSDPDSTARSSIDAWAKEKGKGNVLPALDIDASSPSWPIGNVSAVLCVNMIHISPWTATVGLFHGAARALAPGAFLFTYGPYRYQGRHTSESNAHFDITLRQENPDWGVRDLEAVIDVASTTGFSPPLIQQMPANNMMLIFRKADETNLHPQNVSL